METETTDIAVEALKQKIGFGTALKVTLGFYVAQFIATLIGFAVLSVIVAGIILALMYFVK